MSTRATHTFAILDVSAAAYAEIRAKLKDAGYEHAFHDDGKIDLHGLALACEGDDAEEARLAEKKATIVSEARAALKATESASTVVHSLPDEENPFAHEPVDRLLRFKTYVHDRLDRMNVPADPEPAGNAKHGCRIEGRINWLVDQMISAEDKVETLITALEKVRAMAFTYRVSQGKHMPDDWAQHFRDLEDRAAKCLGKEPQRYLYETIVAAREIADLFVLVKRGAYWRPKACGYAEGILYAGTYTREEAAAYVNGSSGEVTSIPLVEAIENAPRDLDLVLLRAVVKLRGAQ